MHVFVAERSAWFNDAEIMHLTDQRSAIDNGLNNVHSYI